ncbi:MAG: class E sortase [Candidatus Curtissbacteria bacterium]|nr:class E sortase [Candidatus Curtissbacteria bacterium]
MALAVYIKAPPKGVKIRHKNRERAFFGFITGIGILSIIFAAWPFIVWEVKVLPKLTAKSASLAPVPKAQVLSAQIIAQNVQVVKDPDGFSYFTTDFRPGQNRPQEFSLSVPKLKIKDAKVLVDSLKFDNNLAHFPGTALPGQVGNGFITGHSVLPQFADPKNYRAIFTNLSDLEIGDDIEVNLDNRIYHYIVQYSKIVDPKDTSVLAPISAGGRNLTLMSCVPPGTSIKRIVVIASLL